MTTVLDRRSDLFRWTIDIHNAVNKALKKPIFTEQEVLAYYKRLGERDRSPVWKKEDMQEIDMSSFIRGFAVGFVGIGLIGGGLYGLHLLNMV